MSVGRENPFLFFIGIPRRAAAYPPSPQHTMEHYDEGDRTVGMGMKSVSRLQKTGMAVGGGAGLLGAVALRGAAGSPVPVWRLLGADALLPPLWLMGLVWLAVYVLAGGAAGYLATCSAAGGRREALLWRGGTFLALALGLSFCWYSCLFASFLLLLSWICLAAAVFFAVLSTVTWWQLSRPCALAVGLMGAWFLCLALVQFALLLRA